MPGSRRGIWWDETGATAPILIPRGMRMEVLTVITQAEREWAIHEARVKAERDYSSLLRDAQERGFEKGLLKGLKLGHDKAQQRAALTRQFHVFQKILKQPPTPLADPYALPEADLVALL